MLNSNGIYAEMWNQQSQKQTKPLDPHVEGDQEKYDETVKEKGAGKNSNTDATWIICYSIIWWFQMYVFVYKVGFL